MALINGVGEVNGYTIGPRAKLRGADLRGANLEGANMQHADLRGAHLDGANLKNSLLHHAILDDAFLTGAELHYAKLWYVSAIGAHIDKCFLGHAELEEANLSKCILDKSDFSNATLVLANLSRASAVDCIFRWALLKGTIFYKTDLTKSTFVLQKDSMASAARWQSAILTGVTFYESSLDNTNLDGAQLDGAKIRNCYLQNAGLKEANLTGASIINCDFKEAEMEGAILDSVVLRHTKFIEADLTSASLKNAKLKNADFRGARLYETSFKDADLLGSNFFEAELSDTDFSGTALDGKSDEEIVDFGLAEPRRALGSASGPLFKLKKELFLSVGDTLNASDFKKAYPNEFRKLMEKASGGSLNRALADRIERESLTPFKWYVTRQIYDYSDWSDQRLSSEPNEVLVLNAYVGDDWIKANYESDLDELYDTLENDRPFKHPKEAFPLMPIGWVRFARDDVNGVILIEEIQSDWDFVRNHDPKQDAEHQSYPFLRKYAARFYDDAIALVFEEAREGGYTVEMLGYEDKKDFKAPKSVYVDLPRRLGMTDKRISETILNLKGRVSYYNPNPSRPKRWRGRHGD